MNYAKSLDEYFANVSENKDLLLKLREIILETPLAETLKWGGPVYTYKAKNLVGIGSFKSYAGLWFFQGALLSDPYNVLINAQEGRTRALRQWHIPDEKGLDKTRIHEYIYEAITCQDNGKYIAPKKKTNLIIPRILLDALNERKLKIAFESYKPYKQREFAEYISEAKRESTLAARLEKCLNHISKGISLNDKYR